MSKRTATTTDSDATDAADNMTQTPTEVTSGSTTVVRALKNAGIKTAFGVQDGATTPIYNALYHSDIRHVAVVHEQGVAHAIDAHDVVRGDPGICLATSDPGAANLVISITDTNMDSGTVLVLTGRAPSNIVGFDAFQETSTAGVTTPITKCNCFTLSPDIVGDIVGEAFMFAAESRSGPTLVDLPKDASLSGTNTESGPAQPPEICRARTDPADSQVEVTAHTIERAEEPLLLFDDGIVKADAVKVARQFTAEHRVPVVATMPGIDAIPEDHELCLLWAGMHGAGCANMVTIHTSYLITVGTWFDDHLTGGIDTFAPEAEVVHIDVDPTEISKNVHANYLVVGDAGRAVERADVELSEGPDVHEWIGQRLAWKNGYLMDYAAPDNEPLKPQFVAEVLDEATPDETIVTSGVGQHQIWTVRYWAFAEPRQQIPSHGPGTMDYGLPTTIDARVVADDNKAAVCVDGDTSFLMTIQELSIAVRRNLDITVVILNNEYIGMIRQWQDILFEGRHATAGYDWCSQSGKLAGAFGAHSWTVDSCGEVPDITEEALAYDGPSVIDFHVDPTENAYPMVSSDDAGSKFALSEDQL